MCVYDSFVIGYEEKMNIQTGFEFSQDASALAADGMQQDVDDRTLFGTPAPLAASTVSRDTKRYLKHSIYSC